MNLATQRLFLMNGQSAKNLALAVMMGTLVGLMVKYMLDKRWIFFDTSSGVQRNSRTFLLYTVTGIGTTSIFWGSETAFWLIWRTDAMREFGAIIGLSIGYVAKFWLDSRFVFNRQNASGGTGR